MGKTIYFNFFFTHFNTKSKINKLNEDSMSSAIDHINYNIAKFNSIGITNM